MAIVMKPNRPNDFIYDPTFILSNQKDFNKYYQNSRLMTAQYAICPIFQTMFSDMRNYPRKQYVIRKTADVPHYIDKIHEPRASHIQKNLILGVDRHKYFHNPPEMIKKISVPVLDLQSCFYEVDEKARRKEMQEKMKKCCKHAKVQTNYRESSAQTSPWQPDVVIESGDPELLKLDFLKWGCGLPAGIHEVALIERARMKRSWKKSFSLATTKKGLKEQQFLIDSMEREQWQFREQEIQDIQDLRMHLLENMLNELHQNSKCRVEKKMRYFTDLKLKEKKNKIEKIRKASTREKRRLEFNYKGILSKYGHVDVFKEHADYKSELYIPMTRHGVNPKYGHEEISEASKKYKSQYYKIEDYKTIPNNLKDLPDIKEVKVPGTRLCPRETKWSSPVLQALHNDLKNIRSEVKKFPNLRVRIEQEVAALPTPEIEEFDDDEEAIYQHGIIIQKILRGRTAQIAIFEGRERCRELIDELRGSYALLKSNVGKMSTVKEKTKMEQTEAMHCMQNMTLLEASLKKLGGYVVGTLLDFLNKELSRLLTERKAHAIALLVERERKKREAAEAGRRQKEIRRRKEHDEVFKQVVKVHQDTVDLYLEDIITEGIEFSSKEEAQSYIKGLTKRMDEENEKILEQDKNEIFKEEYIANMIHHFVIPEVEKQIVRQRKKQQQQRFLKTANEEIFGHIENLPDPFHISQREQRHIRTERKIHKEALRKQQMEEHATVLADIQEILDDLVAVPIKQVTLKEMIPCPKVDEDIIEKAPDMQEEESGEQSDERVLDL